MLIHLCFKCVSLRGQCWKPGAQCAGAERRGPEVNSLVALSSEAASAALLRAQVVPESASLGPKALASCPPPDYHSHVFHHASHSCPQQRVNRWAWTFSLQICELDKILFFITYLALGICYSNRKVT